MLMKKIISVFLTALMLISTFTVLVQVQAEEQSSTAVYTYKTTKNKPTMNYMTGEYVNEAGETIIVDTEEEKIATMDLRMEAHGYRIYIDEYSGEVAIECVATGERIFTNPVNASAKNFEEKTKAGFLSQILISYNDAGDVDSTSTDGSKKYNSYENAVSVGTSNNPLPSQLIVKPIKDGIRVEYSIGRVDSRYLVPEIISKDDFENKILNVAIEAGCTAIEKMQLENFFKLYDLDDPKAKIESIRNDWLKKYPMIEKTPIYAFSGITDNEYRNIEKIIKAYCPDYTYEDLDSAYVDLNYTPEEKDAEALFRLALEYKIEETYEGSNEYCFTVRLPANGIRFDESKYWLSSIQILPYMGAGTNPDAGYTFFPDGTGALFAAEDLSQKKADTYIYGKVYGDDYAYYITGTGAPHNEIVRYPVFGIVDRKTLDDGTEKDTGFLAIVEEGDSMTKLISYYNYSAQYNAVRTEVNPRPYDLNAVSDSPWPKLSPRKYTGDFKIKYIMLTDDKVAEEKNVSSYYETSYLGMAQAYRAYLVGSGVLTKLTEEDIKEGQDLPLYIETFGAIETTKKFLSIPYSSEVPLTSFSDIQKMYAQLSEKGVNNVNFIMTGYRKGGLGMETIPYKLNWDKAVEDEGVKFDDLLEDAREKGYGVYPDFDFVFSSTNKFFDGLSLSKHAIRSIDDRYMSKREYSATRQTYINYFELVMSPAYFDHFYTKLTEKYLKYNPLGISVSTLGSYLSSDLDEDEPYTREDSKQYTVEAFEYFNEKYSKVLTSGGNAYTWKYVDYITDVSLDSSRHARSCATVPFLGIVLHGYVQFAGSAINMEGNIDYALLRAIENGASLKFILSYRNTENLKDYYDTSVYYSVRYNIWVEDLVKHYNTINGVLKDVQTSAIINHKFIHEYAVRIPDDNELEQDAQNAIASAEEDERNAAEAERETIRKTLQEIRKNLYKCNQTLPTALDAAQEGSIANLYLAAVELGNKLDLAVETMNTAKATLEALKEAVNDENLTAEEKAAKAEELKAAEEAYNTALENVISGYKAYSEASKTVSDKADEILKAYEFASENIDLLDEEEAFTAAIRNELKNINADLADDYENLQAYAANQLAGLEEAVKAFAEAHKDILPEEAEEDEEPEEITESVFNKYDVSENSVVYEEYENGKKLVLNFNNYAIKVTLNGVSYTVEAYGFIVIE